MASVRRNPQGPLRNATLTQVNEVLFWDKTVPPPIDPDNDDQLYVVKSTDRHDLVAQVQLGSSQLGWVIMERQDQNGAPMRLWPNDWVPGRRIMIPSRDSLSTRNIV